MKDKLISKEEIRSWHPIFKGRLGELLLKAIFKFGGINKVNAVYDASKHLNGLDFVDDMIEKLKVKVVVENPEFVDQFAGQPFATVSNHPYGHIDGIIAISVVGHIREDYKMMVNWALNQIDTMADYFIGVNPYSKDNKLGNLKSSVGGVKQSLEHVRGGHPIGFFPAGGVSNPHLFSQTKDREWQPTVLRLIKKAKIPVIPLYISGNNSWLYRFLGLIDWRVRTVRLFHEVTNKKGKTIYLRFGKPISVEEQAKFTNIEEFGEFLKEQTYALR